MEKGQSNKYEEAVKTVERYLPGIVCWGDSLTYGACESCMQPHPYANRIKTLVSQNVFGGAMVDGKRIFCPPVVNMGVGGETTATIIGRNGAIPFVVSKDFVISKYISAVPIEFTSEEGRKVAPLLQDDGSRGLNNVVINGVEGRIETGAFWIEPDPKYTFRRLTEGEEVLVKKGTKIITSANSKYLDYVAVIFIGTNGGWEDENGVRNPDVLVSQINKLIDHQTTNKDRYLVVGLHTENKSERALLEKTMQESFGEKYFNLREYFSSMDGVFKDYNLEPTNEDIELMKEGKTPYRFLKMTIDGEEDATHFLAYAYDIIGDQIYKRLDNLGYFEEVKKALGK